MLVRPAITSAATQLAAAITRYVLLSRFGGVGEGAPGLSAPADPAPPAETGGSSGPIVDDVPAGTGEGVSEGDPGALPPVPDALRIGTSRGASPNSILKIVSSPPAAIPAGRMALPRPATVVSGVCPK